MQTAPLELKNFDPVLAAFCDTQVRFFGSVELMHRGWSYVWHRKEPNEIDHFVVNGSEIVELDFTRHFVMPPEAFKMFVDLEFPTRSAMDSATHFKGKRRGLGTLTVLDLEHLVLWRHFKNSGGQLV